MKIAPDPWPAGEWRRHLSLAVRDLDELLELLDLDSGVLGVDVTSSEARRFPLRVPRGFVSRMRQGDPEDPLLRQVLPVPAEDDEVAGFTANPVGELGLIRGDGLLSKYHGRALLVATGACAIHCRYCFRRHFPYDEQRPDGGGFSQALDRIASDTSIDEVILSGGDPLVLPDDRLAGLAAPSPRSRMSVACGSTPACPWFSPNGWTRLSLLGSRGLRCRWSWSSTPIIPTRSTTRWSGPSAPFGAAGATLLNQAVLLRGVNDSVEVLEELSKRLFDCGVLPYYLHLLDRVAGAAHFEVEEERALEIMESLRARLPGYLVPRLVREVEGAPSKIAVK